MGGGVAVATFVCAPAISCAPATPPLASPLPPLALPRALEVQPSTRAEAITLVPRVETEESSASQAGVRRPTAVVLPLPSDKLRLRRVDVWLSVRRHDDGSTADKQHAVFSRNTSGDSLRFFLPPLSEGLYEAELRALALVDSVSTDGTIFVDERHSSAVVSVVATAPPKPTESIHEFRFHFEAGRTTLIAAERGAPRDAIEKIRSVLAEGRLIRASVNCWASGEGSARYNMDLSRARCDWCKRAVWDQVPGTSGHPFEVTPHGSDRVPVNEPVGARWKVLELLRRKNRVAVLRLVTSS